MANFPPDPFDDVPSDLSRVGAHRAPARRGGGWLWVLWSLLAIVVLVFGGLYALSRIDSSIDFELPLGGGQQETEAPVPSATPTVAAVTDPATLDPARLSAMTITVLNGTPIAGLQDVAGDALLAVKWPVTNTIVASANDVARTYVYYGDPLDEDVALGVAQALGAAGVRQSDSFPGATLTVVLGADYADAQ